jgi:hypothetical protein
MWQHGTRKSRRGQVSIEYKKKIIDHFMFEEIMAAMFIDENV